MHPAPAELQTLSVRRAKIADTDKVRYRVYSTPVEFIAVIAESALMAVKVSGISKPHKIVRDLPTDGIAIEAMKMAAVETTPEQVKLGNKADRIGHGRLMTDLHEASAKVASELFKPLTLGELQSGEKLRAARILPPEMLNQIIEEHIKLPTPSDPEHVDTPLGDNDSMPSDVLPIDSSEALNTVIEVSPTKAEEPPLPELSQEEKLLQMAEILPSQRELAPDHTGLSPEEVQKLLNE